MFDQKRLDFAKYIFINIGFVTVDNTTPSKTSKNVPGNGRYCLRSRSNISGVCPTAAKMMSGICSNTVPVRMAKPTADMLLLGVDSPNPRAVLGTPKHAIPCRTSAKNQRLSYGASRMSWEAQKASAEFPWTHSGGAQSTQKGLRINILTGCHLENTKKQGRPPIPILSTAQETDVLGYIYMG